MANKASKQLAKSNATKLNKTHLTTLSLHTFFILYRILFRHGSWKKYLFLSLPALVIEFYLERLGRPKYNTGASAPAAGDSLRSPGEDLEAEGVTQYLWDIVYWTWLVLAIAGVAGEWAWWIWSVIPLYAIYLAATTYNGLKNGMIPGMPAAPEAPPSSTAAAAGGLSNRQKKIEKRGGQKVSYR